jgi:invasion protein IalB
VAARTKLAGGTRRLRRRLLILPAVSLLLAGCASVQLDRQKPAATTLAPFNAQLGLNRVSVPEGSRLAAASIDGKTAFCTLQPAWFALGEARSVCFTDEARTGYLDSYYVLGTLRSLTYNAHIPYTLDAGDARYGSPSHVPPSRGRWTAECKPNRFHDNQDCDLSMKISSDRPIVAGSLSSYDGGRSWSITTSPPPEVFLIRVDQNAAIEGFCRGPVSSCDVTAAPGGKMLTDQLRTGRQLAIQVTVVRGGQLDRDYSLDGFPEALAEVQSRLSAR